MFDTADVVVEAFTTKLSETYRQTYSNLEPSYPGIIGFVGSMALENIANSDAHYHDMNKPSWSPPSARSSPKNTRFRASAPNAPPSLRRDG